MVAGARLAIVAVTVGSVVMRVHVIELSCLFGLAPVRLVTLQGPVHVTSLPANARGYSHPSMVPQHESIFIS